jgi:preprotein translocase subunit SecA
MMAKEMGVTIKPKKGGIKVKPNEPCPCGSGKKVKKCCTTDMNGK